ncbi:MAG TPA: hypothetical protein VHM64_12635 [Candidatus Binatia bacterium]|nr:hypothetical protein [Candidatus Binatia bacterium]
MIHFLILLLQHKVTSPFGALVIAAIAVALAAPSAAAMMLTAENIRATLQRHIVENSPWSAENV